MTQEEQRIAIAEACGWTRCHKSGCDGRTWRYPTDDGCCVNLPNYPGDLNAMHDAERQLLSCVRDQATYIRILKELSFDNWTNADGWACFAKANIRAETLLKTLSLLKD